MAGALHFELLLAIYGMARTPALPLFAAFSLQLCSAFFFCSLAHSLEPVSRFLAMLFALGPVPGSLAQQLGVDWLGWGMGMWMGPACQLSHVSWYRYCLALETRSRVSHSCCDCIIYRWLPLAFFWLLTAASSRSWPFSRTNTNLVPTSFSICDGCASG